MAIDFGKYGTVVGTPQDKKIDFSKYGTLKTTENVEPTGMPKYAVDETREEKKQRYQEEAQVAIEESDTANSVIERYIRPIAQAILPGTAELGDTLKGLFLTGDAVKDYEIINGNLSEANLSLVKTIREREKKGQNTDDLKRQYNKNIDAIEQSKAQFEKNTVNKTPSQVAGELGMTALNVLTAGTYSKAAQGMKAFSLGKSALPDVLTKTVATVAQPTGLLTKEGMKRVALGAGIGEAYDITQNMQDGLTGPAVLTEGDAKYFGAGLPIVSGLGGSVYSKLSSKATRNDLGNVYRDTFGKYVRSSSALEQAERINRTDPIGVLQMYGKETLPQMSNGSASTAEAKDFLKLKIKELSEIRNEDLFLNDSRIPLSDYRKYSNDLIDTQNWSASKKNKVRIDVNRIIDDLEQSYKNSPKNVDGLELNELGLIKTEQTGKSKAYNNPNSPFDYDAHAITGKSARDLVELFSESQTTKDLNKLIQGHYDAIDLMEALDGKKVQGGMLSRQFSRLTGTLIGTAIDGTGTGIAGNIIAGKIAEIIQNQFITNPLKKLLINNLKQQAPKQVDDVLRSIENKYGDIFQDLFPQKQTSKTKKMTKANNTNPISDMVTRNEEIFNDKGTAKIGAVIGTAGAGATVAAANASSETKYESNNPKPKSLEDFGREEANKGNAKPVEVSAYSPTEDQTDDEPEIMASGKKIYDGAIATGDRTIPFGTKVYIPELDKIFTVEDRLNKRYQPKKYGKQIFDLLIPEKGEAGRKKAKEFGRQKLTFVVVGNDGR